MLREANITRDDCWDDATYQKVIEKVKNNLWLYSYYSGGIEPLMNAVTNLTKLNKRDLDYLAIMHFLLSDEVKAFVSLIPFRDIPHSTKQKTIINRGMVKGKIDWNLTLKQRLSEGNSQHLFICKPPSRIHDLPENQLLKLPFSSSPCCTCIDSNQRSQSL
jgi:hypothetical protein